MQQSIESAFCSRQDQKSKHRNARMFDIVAWEIGYVLLIILPVDMPIDINSKVRISLSRGYKPSQYLRYR